jgi:two-component system nitrogen regulation response regulator GlnG
VPSVLIIDDEQNIRYSFRRAFEGDGLRVLTARTAIEGLEQVRAHHPDVVVLDLQLPDRSGLDLFQELHAQDPRRPVIFITAHGTTDTAIEAMKGGAFDYQVKPIDLDRFSQVLHRALEAARLMQVPAVLPAEDQGDRIVGRSPVIQEMCKAIGRIAPQDVNVLIRGESGTGKELVARALYQHSARSDRPFLAINCAAIPETLLESELFGHEEGAFTGAVRRRIGKFEQVSNGTLFLDEIGDMATGLQAKILRVLQDNQFQRLGSNQTVRTQVRVLAATNQNLEQMVDQGRFRKDLYYRLNVVALQVPPLRERSGDVAELAHYFLFRFNRELNLDLRGFAPETLDLFEAYGWPGNVRELQSTIKQAMLTATGHLLLPEFLPEQLVRGAEVAAQGAAFAEDRQASTLYLETFLEDLLKSGHKNVYGQVIHAVERVLFTRVLKHTGGHQTQASEVLGLNRATLRHKLRSLGLAIDRIVTDEGQDPGKETS